MALTEDRNKRQSRKRRAEPHFVVQHHGVRTDHYDFAPGRPSFQLHGDTLHGGFTLTRMRLSKDDNADTRRNPLRSHPESVLPGRTSEELS